MYYDIREFGAVGDGRSKDTNAIQETIDKCSEKGGGRVIIPSGVFLAGTLELKNNVELHLMSGAKLLGSSDPNDYTERYNSPYDTGSKAEHATGMHLITAWKKENISITGSGIIDGNVSAFLGPETEIGMMGKYPDSNWEYKGRWRPGQMIAFLECKSVRIEGVTCQNSTYWTIWPYACNDVLINCIKIRNDFRTPNGDGIDPDCCKNVVISNCNISSGDDAIALRANQACSGLENDLENVVITNCILNTPLGGIRFGPSGEMSKIRNITATNCVIENASSGILFSQWHRPPHWNKGVLIENIRISNMIINARRSPLRMYLQENCGGECGFRNISISNVSATGMSPCTMIGNNDCVFDDIYISDFNFSLTKLDEHASAYDKQAFGNAFYVKDVKNVILKDLKIDVSNPEVKGLKNIMYFEKVKKVQLDNLDIILQNNKKGEIVIKAVGKFGKNNCKILNKNSIKLKIEN